MGLVIAVRWWGAGCYLPAVYPVLLPAAGTLTMSIKENYRSAVNHRLVTELPLVISGWLKVDRPLPSEKNIDNSTARSPIWHYLALVFLRHI